MNAVRKSWQVVWPLAQTGPDVKSDKAFSLHTRASLNGKPSNEETKIAGGEKGSSGEWSKVQLLHFNVTKFQETFSSVWSFWLHCFLVPKFSLIKYIIKYSYKLLVVLI